MTEYYQGPNNSAELKAVTITLTCVSAFFVVWRIIWRVKKGVLGLSDYLVMVGMCLCICLAIVNLDPYFRWGYGYHKVDLPVNIQTAVTPKIESYINQIFFKLTSGIIKLSVCVIYMSIFKKAVLRRTKVVQYCNYVLMAVVICYYIAGTLVSAFQCTPTRKAWRKSVAGKCIDNDQFRVANACINALTSVALVIIPFPALLTTEHRSKELWQFFGLISIGLVHTGCAITRIVLIYTSNPKSSTDPQWYNTSSNTIAMAEIFTALLVATIITMRPCFQFVGHAIFSTVSSVTRSKTATKNKNNSRVFTGTTISTKGRQGFNKIAVTRELDIELHSEDRSTNDLVLPGYEHAISSEGKSNS